MVEVVGSVWSHAEHSRVPQLTRSPNGEPASAPGGYYIQLLSNIDFLNNEELSFPSIPSNIREDTILETRAFSAEGTL